MDGIPLSSLSGELYSVKDESLESWDATLAIASDKLSYWRELASEHFGSDATLSSICSYLTSKELDTLTFDEVCKLWHSSARRTGGQIDKLFETDGAFEIIRKIKSSIWRWGMKKATWNEIVDAYNGIRSLRFADDPDFELHLDHSTGYNECGYSKYSRTFLDGVFGLLIYYRRKHVMTIGFSITSGRQLLLQQVQLAQRTGNRWLYRFPKNRLEFAIDMLLRSFTGYRVSVIDGAALVEKTLSAYRNGLVRSVRLREQYQTELAGSLTDSGRQWVEGCLTDADRDIAIFTAKIAHLEEDADRLTSFYANPGRYSFGSSFTVNGLRYRAVR